MVVATLLNGGLNSFVSCSQCQHHCSFIYTAISTKIFTSCITQLQPKHDATIDLNSQQQYSLHDPRYTKYSTLHSRYARVSNTTPKSTKEFNVEKIRVSVQLLHEKMQQCSEGSPQKIRVYVGGRLGGDLQE